MGKVGADRAGASALDRPDPATGVEGAMAIHMNRIDELALITLDRPEALNALSFALLHDLSRQLDSIADSDTRALLVTGAGDRAFSAGADIKELMGRSLVEQRAGATLGQAVLAKLDQLPMPSIALINGYAFGGGLELALACTFRLAAPTATLGFPEIKLGLIPGYGGTQRLPRLIGEARATELILTGRTVAADEAERMGLINHIVEGDLIEAGQAFAREMTGFSLPVLCLARDAVRRAHDLPLHDGLKIEADLSTLAFQTEDAVEGMTAFIEKRKAVFRDG
jgi:enoyl-CoA hydratase